MNLVIKNVNIHQDAEGRFSLNDLHRAAGSEERHLPKFFLANQQTQDLITEITSSTDGGIPPSPLSVKKGGHGQGSYGCRELVYAYAMWISPKFHLEVIRTFDAVVTGTVSTEGRAALPHPAKEFRAYYGIARLIGLDKNAAAISANQAAHKLTGTNVLALLDQVHLEAERQELYFTPTELGQRIGVSARAFNQMLADARLQKKEGDHWVPLEPIFCRILDTGKRHNSGAMVQQIKWSEFVLPLLG